MANEIRERAERLADYCSKLSPTFPDRISIIETALRAERDAALREAAKAMCSFCTTSGVATQIAVDDTDFYHEGSRRCSASKVWALAAKGAD